MRIILTLIVLCVVLPLSSHAQQKIGVVDIDATVNEWNRAVKLDAMLNQKSMALKRLVEMWLDKLQDKYNKYDNLANVPTQQSTLAVEILDGQEDILLFERIVVDTIPQFRAEVIQLIENKIQETIDAVAVANDYDLIIAKDNILFYRGKEIDELIVTYSIIDLQDIQIRVDSLNAKLTAWIEEYTNRIEQY